MRRFFFISLLVILFSCEDDKPEGIVSTDKMENILWDMMRADEMISHQYNFDSTLNRKKKTSELYSQIFSIHKISYKDFQKNFKYYQSRPDLLKIIFDSLSQKQPAARPALKPELIKPI